MEKDIVLICKLTILSSYFYIHSGQSRYVHCTKFLVRPIFWMGTSLKIARIEKTSQLAQRVNLHPLLKLWAPAFCHNFVIPLLRMLLSTKISLLTFSYFKSASFLFVFLLFLFVSANNEDDRLDFSRHYTGIVIGVACAAIFAIFSVIAFSHARSRLRERRSGRSLTRSNRQSVSFPDDDVIELNAPPTYDDGKYFFWPF